MVAVSGGPDSMALLHLAARWRGLLADEGAPEIFAASVDHGLRAAAKVEVKLAAARAAQLGVAHATLRWRGVKPESRIQERARDARYDLLQRHAAKHKARVVMTAHHGDDQAATILFRLLRGSSIGGLAGMKAESARGALTIARPLLACSKQALVDYCHRHALDFAEDPSNADAAYARTRMKPLLATMAGEGLDSAGWARLGRRAARADAALELASARAFEAWVRCEGSGFAIDFTRLAGAGEEIAIRVLGRMIEQAAGAGAAVRLEQVEALHGKLAAAQAKGVRIAATLSGLLIRLSARGVLTLVQEAERGATKKPPKD